ncbi:DUF3667 domain-containing protein [Xanthocytophaga flava]|uniref:DUF3667 domain-containing protein n=1 Tax=Xanthocytophaga flava TaxID=3048013 RepID=UPI0028D4BEF2|nr:DUF3667 domain-containing protein [Xanthocytophaga flavus]MDJ1467905.1 DUF3667 domain-containing protein [Xanthocytophaga flavus]
MIHSEHAQTAVLKEVQPADCKNCGNPVTETFCGHCGQRQLQPRLTIKELLSLAYESLVDFDRGFLFTTTKMFTRPQGVIADYITGKRIIYTNPVKYLLLWLGISTFIGFSILDMDAFTQKITEQVQTQKPVFKNKKQQEKYQTANARVQQFQQFITQNPQFMYAILIPILALGSSVFFRKQRYTYAEHLLMNTYTMAQSALFSIPGYLLYRYFPTHFIIDSILSTSIAAIYYSVVGVLFFYRKSYFTAAVKSLMNYVIAYMLFFLLAGIVGFIYGALLMQ